jgi:hypothetical protein
MGIDHGGNTSFALAGNPRGDVPRGHEEPRGGQEYQLRALTACSMRSIPFSMFFMDMA